MKVKKFYAVEYLVDGNWQLIEWFCLKKSATDLFKAFCKMHDEDVYRVVKVTVENAGTVHEKKNIMLIAMN
jgi:hypothetical protein